MALDKRPPARSVSLVATLGGSRLTTTSISTDGPFEADLPAADLPAADLPAALPVELAVRGQLAESVRRTVEGALGWQLVDELTAPLVPPAVRLVDPTSAVGGDTPTVMLIPSGDAPAAAGLAVLRLRPAAVTAWPCEGPMLAAAVVRATAAPRSAAATTTELRVGGSAGGVGTTTVALALTAAAAWRGAPVLLASCDRVLLPTDAPAVDPSAMAAPDLFARAASLQGVPGARVVRTTTPATEVAVIDPAARLAVLDVGVADEVDVLVVRPDAAGLAALERTPAAAVVVTGTGAVPARVIAAATGGRRRVDLPMSHRVARAAAVGRVPSALPGRYIRALAGLVPSGAPG